MSIIAPFFGLKKTVLHEFADNNAEAKGRLDLRPAHTVYFLETPQLESFVGGLQRGQFEIDTAQSFYGNFVPTPALPADHAIVNGLAYVLTTEWFFDKRNNGFSFHTTEEPTLGVLRRFAELSQTEADAGKKAMFERLAEHAHHGLRTIMREKLRIGVRPSSLVQQAATLKS